MFDNSKNYATLSLKVMINKKKGKVLFAEADNQFVDILLSFLTLPLGRIVNVCDPKIVHGDVESVPIGSLSSLYHSLKDLDSSHFWTGGAKQTLLYPTSSFKDEYKKLKLDITHSGPTDLFYCQNCKKYRNNRREKVHLDDMKNCDICVSKYLMSRGVDPNGSYDGVFTINKQSFVISDDLQILPNETGLLGIIGVLGIKDMDKAEQIQVSIGFHELLKASLMSPTPLSDVILKKTTQTTNPTVVESSPVIPKEEYNPNSRDLTLKVIIQKSTGKLLYAEAKEKFIDFLCSFLFIPLGRVGHLLSGKTGFKAINNLYRSTTDLIADDYFKTKDTKKRLLKPNVDHGCISKNHILPLTEGCLPADDDIKSFFLSSMFPNGQGSYLCGSRTYQVMDDLTVTHFCFVSILGSLKEQKIPIHDVKEVELQIGSREALSILKASLTSTTALSDHISNKQPKRTCPLSDAHMSNKQPRRSL